MYEQNIKHMLETIRCDIDHHIGSLVSVLPENGDLDTLRVDINGVAVLLNAGYREIKDVLACHFDEE